MDDDTVFQADDDVLVVHAHPDDEVFCTGAAILAAKTAGARVRLSVFTGGEGRSAALTPAALADARERRPAMLTAACAHLGLNNWDYLTTPGQWTDTPQHPESTMAAASPDDLADAVARRGTRGLSGLYRPVPGPHMGCSRVVCDHPVVDGRTVDTRGRPLVWEGPSLVAQSR